MKYKILIGLEIHIQLNCNSKLFCGCSTVYSGLTPNKNICEICMGYPGTLPVVNKEAVNSILKLANVMNCTIADQIIFDRKNYFYPDLPKGYQITQFFHPTGRDGFLEIIDKNGKYKKIKIREIHLEEDAGKSIIKINSNNEEYRILDFNRASVPLIEIVTEPVFDNSEDAKLFLQMLKSTVREIEISECDMENGTLRCDANLSVTKTISCKKGSRCEIKNLNSFNGVKKALDYEIKNRINSLEKGEVPEQNTLLWNEKKLQTEIMRKKENSDDYRYFKEPDIPPYIISEELIAENIIFPEIVPINRIKKYRKNYNISIDDSTIIAMDRDISHFFDKCCEQYKNIKLITQFLLGEVLKNRNKNNITILKSNLTIKNFIELLKLIENKFISNASGKKILELSFKNGDSPRFLMEKLNLKQINDEKKIEKQVIEVMENNDTIIDTYLKGKDSVKFFFIGEVMKKTDGRANPLILKKIVDKILKIKKMENQKQ